MHPTETTLGVLFVFGKRPWTGRIEILQTRLFRLKMVVKVA